MGLDLDSKATQSGFAKIVGVSQQAIQQRVADGQLVKGQTYAQWLYSYCAHLREEAAGRSGDDHAALTRARTEQATADARIKNLNYYRELGLLSPTEEARAMVTEWAQMARSEVGFATEKLVTAIESKYGIEVDPQIVDDAFAPAYRAIGSYPTKFGTGDDSGGGGSVGSAGAETDPPVAD